MAEQGLLPVWDSISAAWKKVHGAKSSVWAAIGITFLVLIAFSILEAIVKSSTALTLIVNFASQIINMLLQMGLLYIGIQRAKDAPINYRMMFMAFRTDMAIKIILFYLLQIVVFIIPAILAGVGSVMMTTSSSSIASFIGFLLLVIGVVAIAMIVVRIVLGMGFILDKGMAPLEALTKSIEATRSNFWRLVAVFLIEFLILAISAIPFGIGLIWTMPFALILYGIVYLQLAGNVKS